MHVSAAPCPADRSLQGACARSPAVRTYEYGVPHEGAHEALRHPHGPHHHRLVGGDGRKHPLAPLRICGEAGWGWSDVKSVPNTLRQPVWGLRQLAALE